MTDDLLTFEEAARVVHASPETVKYWVKTRGLPTFPTSTGKTGRGYRQRVRRSDLLSVTENGLIAALKRDHPDLRLLTVKEAARHFGVAHSMVRSWIRTFNVEKHLLHPGSRSFLISLNELEDRLEEDFYTAPYLSIAKIRARQLACGCEYCML